MIKRLATSPHDPLGIFDSVCKNQSVMVSVQYGPPKSNIPIRSTTIGKSRVARDPITMHTSWRSNSDIACVTSWYQSDGSGGVLACCVELRSRTTSLFGHEPSGPGDGRTGRAPTVVAGAGRTNVKTSRWSRRRSMAGASTCSDRFSLVSQRFEPRSVRLGVWNWGWSIRKGSGHGGRSMEDEREDRTLLACAAGVCVCVSGLVGIRAVVLVGYLTAAWSSEVALPVSCLSYGRVDEISLHLVYQPSSPPLSTQNSKVIQPLKELGDPIPATPRSRTYDVCTSQIRVSSNPGM
ncbi:hypothetical protein F511_13974 [Dorcoceras hygrometricum]|uniref:Uncharacterized protein n=1 Tax=Dorcoceras hygrometricum TaxID=472368 RepID=A0A2Z7D3D1_9LAMI|nr:hypothetical protein F511_13974 [Dorcoceras hygrometricum]